MLYEVITAVRAESGKDAAFLGRNRVERPHAFEMRPLRVRHQGNCWPTDPRQIGDLAGMIHPHLDNRGAMLRPKLEQSYNFV